MAIRYANFTPLNITLFQFLLALLVIPSSGFSLPLEYNASYNIEKFGMTIAKSNYSLKHENNGVRMTQHTETAGFVALMRDDVVDENSLLSFQNNRLLLTEYSYKQKSKDKKNRDTQLKIDWIQSDEKLTGKVSGMAHGKKLELNVDRPLWEPNSYLLPLMINTKEKSESQQYDMIIKGRLKTYSFITQHPEEIEVNGNTIKTIKIERKGKTSNDPIYLWLAPSLNNLPVKIEKWKSGELQLTMLLNQARFPTNKNMKFKTVREDF